MLTYHHIKWKNFCCAPKDDFVFRLKVLKLDRKHFLHHKFIGKQKVLLGNENNSLKYCFIILYHRQLKLLTKELKLFLNYVSAKSFSENSNHLTSHQELMEHDFHFSTAILKHLLNTT